MYSMIRLLALVATAAGTLLTHEARYHSKHSVGDFTHSRRPGQLYARSAGCGADFQHQTGFSDDNSTHHIVSGGKERYYAVQVPEDYNSTKQYPLIFDYHGNGGSPRNQWNNSQYYLNPKGKEYLVVYPQGYHLSWQGPSYADPNINDLQFTTDLLDHIVANYCVDTTRVYASGKSIGGGFVDLLACNENGNDFAAFAMASAALYTDTSKGNCTRKRAILESHGDKDQIIPYKGGVGNGGNVPNIDEWVSWWGQRDCGNTTKGRTSSDLGGYDTTSYSCNGKTDVVFHYQVYDLGHCWPSSTGRNYDAPHLNCNVTVLDFTQKVVDFFGKWSSSNKPS